MKPVLPACCLLLLILPALQAQTPSAAPAPEPAVLTSTRAAFLRQVMTDSQLLTEQYERALAKAELEVAAAGDYEEARAIRQRRDQLKALYAGTVSSLATPLPLAQARLTGSAQSSGETLSGWRSNGSGAEWLNFRIPPGAYHLEFEVNMCDAPVAGSIYASSKFQPQQSALFEFNEVTLLGNAPENRRTFEIPRSTDETTFTTTRVGPLQFTRSPVTLRLNTTAGYPANIIRLRNLRLVPITEDTPAAVMPAAPTSATVTMQQAATSLKSSLETARSSATTAYLAALKTLAASQPGLKDQVEAETRRVQKQDTQGKGTTGLRAITATSSGLDGFESIADAQLADEPPVSGERFKIVHEGRVLPVRLLWIDCAPADAADAGVKRFSKHFGIDDEDAASMGRFAREFTAGYLSGKPLRLLVRPDRDKDGTLAALLFLPDVGLYQNVLVDHGLAAVVPPPRDPRRNATEKALISTLEARETAARRHQPPAGAWALATPPEGGVKP
jgi:endonuclease YncB( thermonuclease family)